MTGMAQTVLGPIPINQLGITLMHEHLLLDLECYFDEPEAASEKKFMVVLGTNGTLINKTNAEKIKAAGAHGVEQGSSRFTQFTSQFNIAFCACRRFSAWVKMVSVWASSVGSSISLPR